MADVARNLPSQLNPKSHASTAVQRPGAQLAPERFFERRMFTDGMLVLPDKPGLGIELDEAALQKYAIS